MHTFFLLLYYLLLQSIMEFYFYSYLSIPKLESMDKLPLKLAPDRKGNVVRLPEIASSCSQKTASKIGIKPQDQLGEERDPS